MAHILLFLAALTAVAYSLVNVFGAWMTSRRKPEVAVLFTFAAALLIIAAAGFSARFDASPWFLGGGVLLASFASYVNARVVLGRVVWRNHLARLAIGLLIYLLGVWAVHLAR